MTTLLEGERLRLSSQVLITGTAKHQMNVLSPSLLIVRGSAAGQVIVLPSAMTLKNGWVYSILNESSEPIVVRDFMGACVARLFSRQRLDLSLISSENPQGSWSKAILNVSDNPVENCLFSLTFQESGLTKDNWLKHHASLSSDILPAIVPFKLCYLVGMSFNNTQDSVSAKICIYKNGTTDLNILRTYFIDKQRSASFVFEQDLLYKNNDAVSVSIEAVSGGGIIAENPMITLYFKVIDP